LNESTKLQILNVKEYDFGLLNTISNRKSKN
jgi:hypothetical protein